jgi:hypothetical protein
MHCVDACDGRRCEGDLGDPAVRSGRHTHDDPVDTRHAGRYRRHQERRRICGTASWYVATGPLDWPAGGTYDHAIVPGEVLDRAPTRVVVADRLGRRRKCLPQGGICPLEGIGELSGVHGEALKDHTVVALGQLVEGFVATCPHIGDDRPYRTQGLPLVWCRSWKDVGEGSREAAEVQACQHPATLPVATCADGAVFHRWHDSPQIGQTAPVHTATAAELSSLASQVDALLERIAALVEGLDADDRSEGSAALLEVERHLMGARREFDRATRRNR